MGGRRTYLTPMLVAATLLAAACGTPAAESAASGADAPPSEAGQPTQRTTSAVDLEAPCVDPVGNAAVPAGEVTLTDDEIAQIRAGDYTAAVTWAGSGPWYEAADAGFSDGLEELGIERVANVSAEYDPAKQADDVQSVMALDPDVVLGSPVDAVAAAEAYRPVVAAGKTLVLSDNVPDGYVAGEDYVGLITGDRCKSGQMIADLVAEAVGGEGKVGMIFYDADFHVTNVLDQHVEAALAQRHQGVEIVAKQGFLEEQGTQAVAAAMILQHPDIEAIYVTWSAAAQGVISALREAGREDVKVVTHDLDETNDLEMATGGVLYGVATEVVYDIGYRLAYLAGYGVLGKEAPAHATVDMLTVTRDNLLDAWQEALHRDPPKNIAEAMR